MNIKRIRGLSTDWTLIRMVEFLVAGAIKELRAGDKGQAKATLKAAIRVLEDAVKQLESEEG